jgi:hypothetical protein
MQFGFGIVILSINGEKIQHSCILSHPDWDSLEMEQATRRVRTQQQDSKYIETAEFQLQLLF